MFSLMTEKHPLKRKSIKPSSSTVRGMLPAARFRALDAAMQSLRATGMRLEWKWRDATIGWSCVGMVDNTEVCELRPTNTPLLGCFELSKAQIARLPELDGLEPTHRTLLSAPVEKTAKLSWYEFELESTAERDLFSELMEAILPLFESAKDSGSK